VGCARRAEELLGRLVQERALGAARRAGAAGCGLPEVGQHHTAIAPQQHVAGRQIAVHIARGMEGHQAAAGAEQHLHRGLGGQRRAPTPRVAGQRGRVHAVDPLQREPVVAAVEAPHHVRRVDALEQRALVCQRRARLRAVLGEQLLDDPGLAASPGRQPQLGRPADRQPSQRRPRRDHRAAQQTR
jgi:hypothetical protein